MLQEFQSLLKAHFPNQSEFLLALSGGLDSVVLAHLLSLSGHKVRFAHINYHLRGPEADADQLWIEHFAQQLGINLLLAHANPEDLKKHPNGIQHAARQFRYDFFESIKNEGEILCTAHHLDDKLEGFFMAICRGEEWQGWANMEVWNGRVFRPLLSFRRQQILAFAQLNALNWREDSSNAGSHYLRNRVRQQIIPFFDHENPKWHLHWQVELNELNQWQQHFKLTCALWQSHIQLFPDGQHIKLPQNPNHWQCLLEYLGQYGKVDKWALQDCAGKAGKRLYIGDYELLCERDHFFLRLRKPDLPKAGFQIPWPASHEPSPPAIGIWPIEQVELPQTIGLKNAIVDLNVWQPPFQWRKWQKGDRIFNLQLSANQKLSDYFTNNKYSRRTKEQVWVLADQQNQLIWAPQIGANVRACTHTQGTNVYFVALLSPSSPSAL